ncbi:hypothetical protein JOL79_09785 [Microbispora sp. RL4-1S]|uniref:Methylamine utilisation protein MauE domain-containing protein n=1 Tax=Microbispora oryzae TaxID=2806554 RepID=A0A941APW2_9ACTN|nr:MauE/DoxX family redox-associated membrane protein [Microbispora oryzae]MBP2704099.1 hypothetical protein [Microbispora oryzae]
MGYLLVALRLLTGIVFVVSAAGKLRGRDAYARFRAATAGLAPGLPSGPLAAAVAGGEVAVAPLLAWGPAVPLGFGVACVLLAGFTVGIAFALRRGARPSCQCFGASSVPIGPVDLARDLLLLAVAASGGLLSLTAGGPEALAAPGLAVAALAAASAALLVVHAAEIAGLFTGSP